MIVPSGSSGGISDKLSSDRYASVETSKRYDRGIRVWGSHGQAALDQARVCLLIAGATGSEALKNLVLGGIRSFTVVDGKKVEATDLGSNYLLDPSTVGTSRAAAVTEGLKELNETVTGSYMEEDPVNLLEENPEFFFGFDLVVGTQLEEGLAGRLDAVCRRLGVPLLLARSYGLVGYVRICVSEHCIVESKPDSEVSDLRIANPWPELVEAAEKLRLEDLDDAEHSHVPYGLLLVKASKIWEKENGNLPSSSSQRTAFKDMLRSWQRSIDGCPIPEENFSEAMSNAHKAWNVLSIPPEVERLLHDESAVQLTPNCKEFWILVAALRRFVEKEGQGYQLPLEGSLPDMHSTTQRYLELQNLYRQKSQHDAAALERHAASILSSLGRDPNSIPSSEIRRFCQHARHLRVVRTRPLLDEDEESSQEHSGMTNGRPAPSMSASPGGGGVGSRTTVSSPALASPTIGNDKGSSKDTARSHALRAAFSSEEKCPDATVAILLRAVDRFRSRYARYPGRGQSDLEEEIAVLKGIASNILLEEGVSGMGFLDDAVVEVVRCGAAELQVVAAFVGALTAQEAIKLITSQYVPIDGTIIYNGMHCTTTILP